MSRIVGRLQSLLLIQAGEAGRVVYFLLFFMLVSTGMAIGSGTANALFLKRIGIEYLPLMYMAQSVLLAVISLGYAAVADRLPAERLFRLLFGILLVLVAGSWILMTLSDDGAVYPAYYMIHEVASEILLVHAALYLGQNMNTLQVKRLAPLMFAGVQAGNIAGGLLLAFVAPLAGTVNLLLIWCLLLVAAVLSLFGWHGRHGVSSHFRAPRKSLNPVVDSISQVRQGIHYTFTSSLMRASSLALFFMVISFYVICYSINRIYNQTFADEAELTGFFGTLTAVTSAVALLLQVFVTGRVIQRFGVRRLNMLFPLTSVAVLAALSFSFTLPVALLGSLNRDALMTAFRNPVRTMFFNVLPAHIQGRARALSVAIVLPVALFICGLLLWIMQRAENPAIFIAPGFLAACLYVWYSHRMNLAYVGTLITTLREHLYLPGDRPYRDLAGSGSEARDEIRRGVAHADTGIAVSFARVLVASFPEQAAPIILQRAASADVAGADRLLGLLGEVDLAGHEARLRALAAGGDTHLRATVLGLLARSPDAAFHDEALFLLQGDNPRLTATAIHVLLQQPGAVASRDRILAAWQGLLQGDTAATVAAMALVPDLSLLAPADRETLVSGYTALFPRLLRDGTGSMPVRVLEGLRAWPHPVTPEVMKLLADLLDSDDPQLRYAVVQCLHRVDTGYRTALLQQGLGDGHARVRQAALDCLRETGADLAVIVPAWVRDNRVSLRAQHTLLDTDQTAMLSAQVLSDIAMSKAREAEQLQQAIQMLREQGGECVSVSRRLLVHVLEDRIDQTVQLALQALEPLHEPGLVEVIRAGFLSGDERHVANAGEALSNLTEAAAGLLHQVLRRSRGEYAAPEAGVFHTVQDVLHWCSGLQEEWVQSCARRALQDGDPDDVYA